MIRKEQTDLKKLLIVFVKNIKHGEIKTRLAATIGNQKAILIYNQLIDITEAATMNLNVDKRIYYSDFIEELKWPSDIKAVQEGTDIGKRMENAFKDGFNEGYEHIVLIGSDLPDISQKIVEDAFTKLETIEVVLGPAQDGGYYLIGLDQLHPFIFNHKPWSQSNLLELTIGELKKEKVDYSLLAIYNDVDTFEDLKNSSLYSEYDKNN